jgi:hypothetical protein
LKQIAPQVEGLARLNRQTLGGSFQALVNQIGDAFEALGSVLQPVIVPVINFLTDSFRGWQLFFQRIRQHLEAIGLARPVEQGIKTPFGAASPLADDEALGELKGIRKNTEQNTEIIRQAFGGPGTIGRQAGTIRALRQALNPSGF